MSSKNLLKIEVVVSLLLKIIRLIIESNIFKKEEKVDSLNSKSIEGR